MSINPACITEIQQAVGRALGKGDLKRIEADLTANMRRLASADPQRFASMSREQRMVEAGRMALAEAKAEANRTAERKAKSLIAQVRETERQAGRADWYKTNNVSRIPWHAATFERLRQIEQFAKGIQRATMSQLIDALNAVEPKFFGFMHDPVKMRAFANAVMANGQHADPVMARAAKTYMDALEALRLRANAAGADIGRLDYGYLPQRHAIGRVAREGQEAWANAVLPLLDRTRYVDEAGQPMDDAAVLRLLNGAWETISTGGLNKVEPGQFMARGSRASRFDEAHRVIHFKDGDAYADYMARFGESDMFQGIIGHVGMMSKTIAMMEELGPNSAATFRLLKDLAERGDGAPKREMGVVSLDALWDTINGTASVPVSVRMAEVGQQVRGYMVATKLQGTLLSAITDVPMMLLTAKSNGMTWGRSLSALVAGIGGAKKARAAQRLGLGVDAMIGEMGRFYEDNMATGFTNNLANATMRLGLLQAWSNALRLGFEVELSGHLWDLKETSWGALNVRARNIMEGTGVTAADWAIWQKAVDVDGRGVLTKEGILAIDGVDDRTKARAIARLLGYIDSEANTGVMTQDAQTRATITQGIRPGTPMGEAARYGFQFKSFGIAMVQKLIRRMRYMPTRAGRNGYAVATMTALTMMGALSLWLRDLASGRDPRDPASGKFWMAAFIQGGGMGIFGDLIWTGVGGNARGGQANWAGFLGPTFGTVADFTNITLGNAARAAEGKEVDFGADAVRFARSNTPFINLWYARAALDQMVFHDLQEQLSPGYLRRQRQRFKKEFGQEFWWQPGGQFAPERAPDIGSDGE